MNVQVSGPNTYLVIDLSSCSSSSNYPISYLASEPIGGWTDEYKTTKLVLRRIPWGMFMMGSPTNEYGRRLGEIPHQVTLAKNFYIGVFEVTQKQWERVMGTWPSYSHCDRDSRPVECVSYGLIRGPYVGSGWPTNGDVDTDWFMGRLRARTGLPFDLPTEAQWEYAERAGMITALNSGYNLTNTGSDAHMDEVGRYWFNGGSGYSSGGDITVGSAKVGSYQPNQWGIYDIHGNIREWCRDWFEYWYEGYPGTVIDPKGGSNGLTRVIRGGCWFSHANCCRVAYRSVVGTPNGYDINVGFRVCLP